MTTVLVCAALRDMERHPNWEQLKINPLEHMLTQLDALRERRKDIRWRYSFYENDSRDATPSILEAWCVRPEVEAFFRCEKLGAPRYRSFPANNCLDRITRLASYRNEALKELTDQEWVLFIEPDVLWQQETFDYLMQGVGDIRSPLSFWHPVALMTFYDPLSTRDIAGNRYLNQWPPTTNEDDELLLLRGQPIEVSSTWNGFCLIRADFIRKGARFEGSMDGEATMFCRKAKALGATIFLHPAIRYSVIHPLATRPWSEEKL